MLDGVSTGWQNHPAIKMWRGHRDALVQYYNVFYTHCVTHHGIKAKKLQLLPESKDIRYPAWLGNEQFHLSHKNNLARKAMTDSALYQSLVNMGINPHSCDINGQYIWPN